MRDRTTCPDCGNDETQREWLDSQQYEIVEVRRCDDCSIVWENEFGNMVSRVIQTNE